MISITPDNIRTIPPNRLRENDSWKIIIPISTAVTGSSAPNIAAVVEPTSLIDTVIRTSDIIVGAKDSNNAMPHCFAPLNNISGVSGINCVYINMLAIQNNKT